MATGGIGFDLTWSKTDFINVSWVGLPAEGPPKMCQAKRGVVNTTSVTVSQTANQVCPSRSSGLEALPARRLIGKEHRSDNADQGKWQPPHPDFSQTIGQRHDQDNHRLNKDDNASNGAPPNRIFDEPTRNTDHNHQNPVENRESTHICLPNKFNKVPVQGKMALLGNS